MAIRLQDDAEEPSKASTLFLGVDAVAGGWAALAVDLGQRFADFTAGGASITEATPASARFNLSHPRTIGAHLEIDNTSSGVIFSFSSGATLLQFDISPAGTLRATSNNTVVGSVAISGLTGSPRAYLLAWISRANPLTTGSSDRVQSWLVAYDIAGAVLVKAEFSHATKTTGTGTATWGGLSASTFLGVWCASAAQSTTEIARDWGVTSPSAPSSSCDLDLPPLPAGALPSLSSADAIYGPVPQWAAIHCRHALRRHWSPLANIVYRDQPGLRATTGVGAAAYRLAPGSTGYRMMLGWLAPSPVPPGATHAWVRVQVRSWVASGAAVPLGLRVYSMSRMPDDPGAGPLVVHQAGEIVTRDDTSTGTGQWDIEALVELAVGSDGWTYLCPAFDFDPSNASANDANARAQIRAFHAVPCVAE